MFFRAATLFSLGLLVAACVSGSLKPLSGVEGLPMDLTEDLKARFELKEAVISDPSLIDPTLASTASMSRSVAQQGGATKGSKASKKRQRKVSSSRSQVIKTESKDQVEPQSFIYPNRKPKVDSIWAAEKLTYDVSYFGITAGEFSLEVSPLRMMGTRVVFPIKGHATSSAVFSLVYRVDDHVESYFDYLGNFSHRFHVVLDESKQRRDSLEIYDSEKKQTHYWNRWSRKDAPYSETKLVAEIESFPQDTLTTLYYLRSVPLEVGLDVRFPVVSEGKSMEVVCSVIKKEVIGSPMGEVSTFVIRPQMWVDGQVKNKEDSFLWLTDDDRRIPVRVEAKVKVGTVVAQLRNFELGNPPKQANGSIHESPIPLSAATSP